MGSTASATQNVTPATRPLFRRINLPLLKRYLETIEADIHANFLLTRTKADLATGVVWREDGLVVSLKPVESPNDIVWVLDPVDFHGFNRIVIEFCKRFQLPATEVGLNAYRGRLKEFFSSLAARFVPPFEGKSLSSQLTEQAYYVAKEMDHRQYVEHLKNDADRGDAESAFLLFEVYGQKGSKYYDSAAAEKLLFRSAQSAFPDACAEVFSESRIRSNTTRRRLLNRLRELGAAGDQQARVLWAEEILEDSRRMKSGECRYPDISGNHAIVAEAVRLLNAASRTGNGEATWALFWNEPDRNSAKAGKYLRLAAKQNHAWACYVLACSLMSGAHGQPRNLRKAHMAFRGLYRLRGTPFPGEFPEKGLYLWAYACMEAGIAIPKELSAELDRVRDTEGYIGCWSHDLLDAIRDYPRSHKTDLFNNLIIEASDAWTAEGPDDEDGNEPGWDEFYHSGALNIWLNLACLTPAYYGDKVPFDRIQSILRSIADKNVHVVQYILGLMGDTSDDWLGRASDGGFALASYHLGFTRYATEPEAALRHLKRVAYQAEENIGDFPERFEIKLKKYDEKKEIISEDFFHEIREQALARIRVIETQLAEENARRQTERDMLSFLSHTLTSATAGASGKLRKIAGELASARSDADLSAYASRLAPTATNIAMVESLVEVFKLYTADPKALRDSWDRDSGGSNSVAQVFALAVRQALLRFYFLREYESAFERLMPGADYDAVSREFMVDMMALDMNTPEQMNGFFDWIRQRLPFLRISLQGIDAVALSQGGPRAIVIFALAGELLGNALKYASGGAPISLGLQSQAGGLELICTNGVDPASPPVPSEGKTGLGFIRQVCRLIGASFDEPTAEGSSFSLRVLLPIK